MTNRTYNPLVSIITPVLNRVGSVEACIESVLRQSYPHIEHVFVDGGSTDGTLDVLSSYNAKYPDRVRFISELDRVRVGAGSQAADKGVQMARGEIIGALGSDDTSEPEAIRLVVEFFRTHPDAYFVFGDCNFIGAKGEVVVRYQPKDFNLKNILNDRIYIVMTSAFYKRAVVEKVGLYYIAPETASASDLDFLIRVGEEFQLYRIDEVLSNFKLRKIVLTGGSWDRTKKILKASYIISRRHGGGILSGYSKRYCASLAIDWLRPVLRPVQPFVEEAIAKIYKRDGAGVEQL